MKLNYLIGAALTIPCLPLMYWQAKRIKAAVPTLPEASEPTGTYGEGPPFQLILIGESTMAGVGVSTHAEGFGGTFAQKLAKRINRKVSWRVYARSGYTTAKMTAKLLPRIEEEQADLIVVATGGNDAFKLTTPGQFKRDVADLIRQLRSRFPYTPVVFPNMPPIKEFPAFTTLIRSTIGRLVELHGMELAELTANLQDVHYNTEVISIDKWEKKLNIRNDSKAYFSDGVHPSPLTYQIWARNMVEWILDDPAIILKR